LDTVSNLETRRIRAENRRRRTKHSSWSLCIPETTIATFDAHAEELEETASRLEQEAADGEGGIASRCLRYRERRHPTEMAHLEPTNSVQDVQVAPDGQLADAGIAGRDRHRVVFKASMS
jgi:hypothetical protein